MRFVPDPWGGSWFSYLRAVLIGLFLLAGLALAIHRGTWIGVTVWAVLLAIAIVCWARDLKNAIQRKSGTGRT
jgi:hypothetical protein